MRRFFRNTTGFCLAALLCASSVYAASFDPLPPPVRRMFVRIGPPPLPPAPVLVKHHGKPKRGYVYRPGYYQWSGRHYVWVPAAYVVPPRPHAYWVPGHWVPAGPRGGYWFSAHWGW